MKSYSDTASGGKVKHTDFPPDIAILADSGKNLIRSHICFGDWVLDSDPGKADWIWKIINEAPDHVALSAQLAAKKGLKMVSSSSYQVMRSNLLVYVCCFPEFNYYT